MKNMRLIREQREVMKMTMNNVQKDILIFLERPQEKQRLVDEYIDVYNKFIDENTDMIEDPRTKMEMHQRVEDLCGKLLGLVEELQKSALEQRDHVMKSGWAEFQLESLLVYTQALMQTEANRYRCFVKFAEDYYAAKDGQAMQELSEDSLFAAIVDGNNLPEVEDVEAGTFPRLEALFQSAMAVVTGETVVMPGAKDTKGRKDAKKEAKKDAGKKKKEEEKKVEENKELTTLRDNEKAILKYRLTMIKEFSERRLKEIRSDSKQLYQRLHDWIRVTIKCQREATNQLSMQLRVAIEEEKKIQEELRMKSFDLIRDGKALYFIIPPPKPLPAIELPVDNRFTVAQLYSLVQDLRLLATPDGLIDLGLLIALLTKKTKIGQLFGSDEGLPPTWKDFSFSTYQKIATLLDKSSTGFVSFASLATFLTLLQSPLPIAKALKDYDMKLSVVAQNENISKTDFMKVDAWFDEAEKSAQRERADVFDRPAFIKAILFDINRAKDKDAVNKKEILKALTAEGIVPNLDELANKGKRYIDIVFGT